MAIDIFSRSRLQFADVVVVDDTEFWDLPILPPVPNSDTDTLVRVEKIDRIDLIALKHLGDERLWDVLADINGYRLLPVDMKPNDLIRIPTRRRLLSEIRPIG